MIDRPTQIITSDYGIRTIHGVPAAGTFHPGIDLRNYDDKFTKRLPAILPESAVFDRATWEELWGWTLVFKPCESGKFEIRFTHILKPEKFEKGTEYPARSVVGYNGVTEFMKQNKLGEHLHFSVWHGPGKKDHEDPKDYLDLMGIEWDYSEILKQSGHHNNRRAPW